MIKYTDEKGTVGHHKKSEKYAISTSALTPTMFSYFCFFS
jgi:hypothetical protein